MNGVIPAAQSYPQRKSSEMAETSAGQPQHRFRRIHPHLVSVVS